MGVCRAQRVYPDCQSYSKRVTFDYGFGLYEVFSGFAPVRYLAGLVFLYDFCGALSATACGHAAKQKSRVSPGNSKGDYCWCWCCRCHADAGIFRSP